MEFTGLKFMRSAHMKTIFQYIIAAILTALVAFALRSGPATPQDKPESIWIIHVGTLLAEPGEAPKERQTLIVRNGRIKSIHDGLLSAADLPLDGAEAEVVDLSDRFVMPGFIDLHVHITFDRTSRVGRDSIVHMDDADMALVAAQNARRTVMAGFTTVRNLGSRGRHVMALRDAIKANRIPGPKILDAGHTITPTGGHADFHGFREEVLALFPSTGVCDGADDCRRAVRLQVKRGADVIKVTATGGVLSQTGTGTGQQFTQEELNAIADAAHALGRKVTAHAHGKEGIIAALRAGFDSIEHAMWADAEAMEVFKETGAWLIPTVWPITYAGDTPEKMRTGPFKDLPPVVMEKLLALGRQPKDMTRLAHEMGVNIALGTDSGVSPHGTNANEFIEYVNIGMSPMEALMAGTVHAAEAGGIPNVGKLTPGMAADIVALAENPLDDIAAVRDVRFVMRDGRVMKREN